MFAPGLTLHHLTGNLLDIPYARVSRLGLLAPNRVLGGLLGGRLSLCDLRRSRLRVVRRRGGGGRSRRSIAPLEVSRGPLPYECLAEELRAHVAHDAQLVGADGLELKAVLRVLVGVVDPAAVPGVLADGLGIADDLGATDALVAGVLEPDDAPHKAYLRIR